MRSHEIATQPTSWRTTHRLDEHLVDVAAELRLDPRRRALAEKAAEELALWISASEEFRGLAPNLFPQGSFLIRTTVRPRKGGKEDEFDLDMVVECVLGYSGTPIQLLELLNRCLKRHPKYGTYVVKMRRCVRVDFPGEFHMDVLPARPETRRRLSGFATAIEVPDRELRVWKPSDPKAYAAWFESRADYALRALFAESYRDLLPEDREDALGVLRQMVQLTKRHRDVVFDGHEDAPRSITLTTLLARYYDGGRSVYLSLRDAMARISEWAHSSHQIPTVPNPVNPDENFAESWDDERFKKFRTFATGFAHELAHLERVHGLDEIKRSLAFMFHEDVASRAMASFAGRNRNAIADGQLRVDVKNKHSIIVPTASGVAVPATTARVIAAGTNFGI